jgi:N-acyl-D-amino-acid deacylase
MRTIILTLVLLALTPPLRADVSAESVRATVEKGLRRVEQGVINYPSHRQCFSCHHQAMAILSLTAAREHGFAVDAELLKKQVDFSLRSFRNKTIIARGQGVGGDSTAVVYALSAFAAAERPYDETTAALLEYLLVKQRKDGSWPIAAFGDRPPTMGSLFTNTGLAVFVLRQCRPPKEAPGAEKLHERIDAAFAKGRAWLIEHRPTSTEDKVFRLRGLVHAGAEPKEIDEARDLLLREQRPDGSWAQLARMDGDAYATATVLMALRVAGVPATDAAYQKAAEYLLQTQKEDGAWIVQTRSRPLQRFFDNGDPGGKSQFISYATTSWAVLALLELCPRAAPCP